MSRTTTRPTLYRQVADRIEGLIEGGTLRPGQRIPSVRRLSAQLSVSISTVLEAYRVLEDRQLVEARPQSGYYVRAPRQRPPEPERTASLDAPLRMDAGDVALQLVAAGNRPDLVPLGAAIPSPEFLPTKKLNRLLAQVARRDPQLSQSYDAVEGYEALRVQIARRALEAGCSLHPRDLITTSGAQEAIQLCLRAVTEPGDTVIIETPTYYGMIEAIASLHLRALEIATDPQEGICLEDLEEALSRESVAAVVLCPSFGNPLGHNMPETKRRELLGILRGHDLPLIEDDAYGELAFEAQRPKAVKAFDEDGRVLLCSSFSKTLAPGYRIGWTAPGRYLKKVQRLKFSSSVATATPTQMAVAAFLESGGFDRYLRSLRRTYRDLVTRMACAIGDAFPAGTRVTRPQGGHVLWVEMPRGVDAMRLHERALAEGISVAPGPLFSAADRYPNCIRVNCAVPWSDRVAAAAATLGRLARETRPSP